MKMKTMKKRIIMCAFVCTFMLVMLPSISAGQYDSITDTNTSSLLQQKNVLKINQQDQDTSLSEVFHHICSYIFWLRIYKMEKWLDRAGYETPLGDRAGGFRIDHVIPFLIACIAGIRLVTWEFFCTILQEIMNWDWSGYTYFQ